MKYNLEVDRRQKSNTDDYVLPKLYINGEEAGVVECIEYLYEMLDELTDPTAPRPNPPTNKQEPTDETIYKGA